MKWSLCLLLVAALQFVLGESAGKGGPKRKVNNTPGGKDNEPSNEIKKDEWACELGHHNQVCQNFHKTIETILNDQIKEELQASYFYQDVGFHFARDDVALHGFAKFFRKSSDEEREHAEKLMEYMNKRGGTIKLQRIETSSLNKTFAAVKEALKLERAVNVHLLNLHKEADKKHDYHLSDYLDSEFLTEQVDSIKELGDMLTKLRRFKDEPTGRSVGVHIIDQELLK